MTKSIRILAAAAVIALGASSAIAGTPAQQQRFAHDGQTYIYTSTLKNGRTVLEGRAYPSGSAFRLIVRGDKVSGNAGGSPVAFDVAEARGATKPVFVATAD